MCSLQLYCPRPSTLSPPPARRGLSLTEVLIAMGILTLGLLGVAAIFPVGSYYMQRAEISERGAQIGRAAMNQLVTTGMLDPTGWRMYTWRPSGVNPVLPTSLDAANNSYQRPFAATLANALDLYSAQSLGAPPAPRTRQQNLARLFGHAYVIDPMAVSTTSVAPSPPGNFSNKIVGVFPASAVSPPANIAYGNKWGPWWWGSGAGQYTWPIRRVTFPQRGPGNLNMIPTVAEHLFRGRDDLGTDLPDRDDRPAEQNWDIADVGGTPTPLARQWTGDYSWMATVVPKTNAARDAMATNPESFAYEVSVVVFYKRVVGSTAPQNGGEVSQAAAPLMDNEPYVKAGVISTGLRGGELLLQQIGMPTQSPFDLLKAGQWIAVCGPHPASSDVEPRFVLKWYQVMSIDTEGSGVTGFDPATQRIATLRGPEWPWIPSPNGPLASSDAQHLSNNLCVCIVRGAIAVHTKTLRLEGRRSTAWGGARSGGSGGFWDGGGGGGSDDYLR